jgi:hypothetical protein
VYAFGKVRLQFKGGYQKYHILSHTQMYTQPSPIRFVNNNSINTSQNVEGLFVFYLQKNKKQTNTLSIYITFIYEKQVSKENATLFVQRLINYSVI